MGKTKFNFGLEIHQRLDTCKLFCSCPSDEGKGEPIKIERILHGSKGEEGEKDRSVEFESKKNRNFTYYYYKNCCCLVDLDEEPPHIPKDEILKLAVEIGERFNCNIFNKIQFMRKIIVDGSIISGFQRTAYIGNNGKISVLDKEVPIDSIFLEEESCKIIKTNKEYSLDRQGIPLVEITTGLMESDDPEFVKKVAEKIGLILRATRKVKRGIGTIRQDVNLSIDGGVRVEIKGFQDIALLPLTIEYEIQRQKMLKTIKRFDSLPIIFDATEYFKDTKSKLFKKQKYVGGMILKGFSGIFKTKITPTKTYGKEVSEHGNPFISGIIHTDEEISKYNIEEDVKKIRYQFDLSDNDLIIFSFGDKEMVMKGFDQIIDFIKDPLKEETRKFEGDGNTSFMRPLSGGSRLYPETDIPIIDLGKYKTNRKYEDPENEIKKICENYGLDLKSSKFVYLSQKYPIFLKYVNKFKPTTLFDLIKNYENIENEVFEKILTSNVPDLKYAFDIFVKTNNLESALSIEKVSDEEIINDIKKEISNFVGDEKHLFKGIMGNLMKKYKGKVSGKRISELLKKEISILESHKKI